MSATWKRWFLCGRTGGWLSRDRRPGIDIRRRGLPSLRATRLVVASAIAAAWSAFDAQGADWPQWRGPNRDGVSVEILSVTNWPPKLAWSNTIAIGESSVVVSEGRLYTMGRIGSTNWVYCLDANTGTNIWTQSYTTNGALNKYGIYGPQTTPTVVGGEVCTFDDAGKLYCFNKTNGTVLWNKALGLNMPPYGFASSPLVDGDLILLNASGIGAAVSRTTHNVLWPTSNIPVGAAYASPVSMTVDGRKMFLVQTVNSLKAIATNGVVLWSYPYDSASMSGYAAADPVVYDGNKILLYENGLVLLQATTNSVSEVWPLNTDTCGATFSTPLIVGGYGYAVDYGGDLVRIDLADGSVGWNLSGFGQGAMTAVDGKLVILSDGQLRVVKIGASGFDEEGRLPVTVSEDDWMQYGWSVPAVYNGNIYCRVGRTLACYSVSGLLPGPSLSMDTNDIVVLCPVGTVATQTMSIVNGGDATLTWSLADAFEGTNFTRIARQFKVAWSSPYSLKYDATRSNLWAHYYGSSDVRQIATNGTEVTTKSMGTNAYNSYAIEVESGNLWGTHYNDKRFVKFNLNDMSVLQRVAYPSALSYVYTMAQGDGRMFAANSGSALYQLNPDTGAVLQTFTIPDSLSYNHHLGYSGGYLWWGTSTTPYNRLVKWDPATGKVRSRFTISGWQNGCSVYDVSASATNTQLWVLTYQHRTGLSERWAHLVDISEIQRLNESTVSGAVPAGASSPLSLVFNGVGATLGPYPVRITITSTGGASREKLVTFVVHATGVNHPPTANAGSDQTMDATGATTPVTLNGSGSSDSDGDTLRFAWSKDGVAFTNVANPALDLAPGVHDFTLTVDDYRGGVATDTVRITINAADIAFVDEPVVMLCPQGSVVTQTVTVLNVGNRTLNWTMTDHLSGTNWVPILKSFKIGWNLSTTAMKYDATNNCLWASYYSSNEVAKLNTANGSVLARKYLAGCNTPNAIEMEGTNLWVANYTATNFSQYNVNSMVLTRTVAQPSGWTYRAYGLAIGGGKWYSTTSGTNVYLLDPNTGAVLATYPTPDYFYYYNRHFGYGEGTLWWGRSTAPANSLRWMDVASGQVMSSVQVGQSYASAMIYDVSYTGTNSQYWVLSYNHNGAYEYWAHLVDLSAVKRVTESVRSGSITAGGSASIQVVFDGRGLARGSYPVQLLFASNDPDEPLATNTVMAIVHAPGVNHPPVANAGPDRTETIPMASAPFIMDLSSLGSTDPDGDPLRCVWTTNGVPVNADANGLIELGGGTHVMTMTVDDYRGGVSTDEMVFTVHADVLTDWPQWYGPNGRGYAPQTNEWLENWPPVIAWTRPDVCYGSFGYSPPWNDNGCPIISDGRVYFAPSGGMFCLDALTGALLWRAPFKGGNPTPAADDRCVYACENKGDGKQVSLICWNKYTGATNWICSGLTIRSGFMGNGDAGNCSSPIVHGDLVILNGTGINKANGKILWSRGSGLLMPQRFHWNSRTYVLDNSNLYDPRTGATVVYAGPSASGYIAFAVPYGNDKTWAVGSVYQIGGTTLWSTNNGGLNWFNQPVVVGDYGYFLDDVHGGQYDNAGGHVVGVDLRTGRKICGPAAYTDTMIAVGDKLVTSGVEGGGVGVIQIGGTNYQSRGVFDLQTMVPGAIVSPYMIPAYANKRIYVMARYCGLTCLYTGYAAPVVNNGIGPLLNETNKTAALNGKLQNSGGKTTSVFVYWGGTDGKTNAAGWAHCESLGTRSVGSFSVTVVPPADSVCYYRCFASNSVGGSWASSSERFTTYSSGAPVDDASLILRWTFEERNPTGAYDVSGNGNNGAGPTIAYTDSIMGAAVLLGDSDPFQCPAFTKSVPGDLTLSFWWKLVTPRGDGIDGDSCVFMDQAGSASIILAASWDRLYIMPTAGSAGSALLSTSKWSHVAIAREGAKHTFYVNGRAVGVQPNGYSGPCTTLRFGGGGSTYMPKSYLDDVRVYRRALSLEEIGRLYSMAGVTNASSLATNSCSVGSDDAEERQSDGIMFASGTNLFLGRGEGTNGASIVGLRFPNVGIPRNASISGATIQFKAANTTQTESTCYVIRGQDAGNASVFGSTARDISNRTLTSAAVEWRPPSWTANAIGLAQRTPDLSGLVQEIVSRSDWDQSNALAFVISGSGQRVFDAVEKVGGTPASLRVTWTFRRTPLSIRSVWSTGVTNEVMVAFDRPVSAATGGSAGNYRISGGIRVLGAAVVGDGTEVVLTTTGMTTGTVYRLIVSGVGDLSAPPNYVAEGSEWLFVCLPSPVQFVRKDTLTRGSWRGVYGGDGRYAVKWGTQFYPSYASITPSGYSTYDWESETWDVRALQEESKSDRYIGGWYNSGTNFTLDVNLTDGATHQLALYCADWDLQSRCQKVDVVEPGTGRIWDSQVLGTNTFTNGVWLVWNITGRKTIRFTDMTSSKRAVVSGIFLDPPAALPGPDENHNGIEDTWEMKHYATTNHPASWFLGCDGDGDGVSDWAEYVAGTDPTNANSYLVMGNPGDSPGGHAIRWRSESNRTYSLDLSTNLVTDWFTTPVVGGLPATPPMNTYTDKVSRPDAVFYRIKVDW